MLAEHWYTGNQRYLNWKANCKKNFFRKNCAGGSTSKCHITDCRNWKNAVPSSKIIPSMRFSQSITSGIFPQIVTATRIWLNCHAYQLWLNSRIHTYRIAVWWFQPTLILKGPSLHFFPRNAAHFVFSTALPLHEHVYRLRTITAYVIRAVTLDCVLCRLITLNWHVSPLY